MLSANHNTRPGDRLMDDLTPSRMRRAGRAIEAAARCLLLVGIASLSGCAIHRAHVAHEAETKLIGISEEALLRCAGAPAQEKHSGSLSFLTYHGGGDGVALGALGSSQLGVAAYKHRYCDATFTLRNGHVADLQYRGRTGGLLTRGEQCAFIVEGCVQ
jgi:hypothetical protein